VTTFRFTVMDDLGYEVTHTMPGKYEVCPRCEGSGKHDHPAFSNGITQEEFDEDPDFREAYFEGHYDVTCEECRGLRVVVEPDEAALNAEMKAALEQHRAAEAEEARERAWERRNRALGIEY
jgi:hypothetical protein